MERTSGRAGTLIGRLRCALGASVALLCGSVHATGTLNLPDTPLFVGGSKSALVQLVVQRDNKLFFEAYPSYEDLDEDGVVDVRFDPTRIDYTGYFESSYCYVPLDDVMTPVERAVDGRCTTNDASWSGSFLNYLTMTRMDIVLRALYGGRRSVDVDGRTVLRRAFVPWEAHTWGIEYASETIDGYRIGDYSPMSEPLSGTRHLIATNNWTQKNDVPYLRVRENETDRIGDWIEKERLQGDGPVDRDVVVDVEACAPGFLDAACKRYPNGNYKPVGLLHEYGEDDSMYFSLVTGSYENNLRGGILRQAMSSFGQSEVDADSGRFLRGVDPDTGTGDGGGIVATLDAIRIPNDYRGETIQNDCGFISDRPFENGECRAWGNPIAEMMYEGMRYLAGAGAPTPRFDTRGGMDATLGLGNATWDDPYAAEQPYPQCTDAYQLVISDPSPSFDGDDLPGSAFATFDGSALGTLHVGELADTISANEADVAGPKFIGEADGVADGSPTPKNVTTLRTARGHAPEAPHRQGGFYASSVAYHGNVNDVHAGAPGTQNVGNFTLALGSQLPTIDVPVAGRTISFAPFGRTVGNKSRTGPLPYFPVNAIVGFVVEELAPDSGSFRVSFEDMEQGGDNDSDAVVRYEFEVVGSTVKMTMTSISAFGSFIQHLGYTVSGSTDDGVYLVLRSTSTPPDQDVDYPLDVPPGEKPGGDWEDGQPLPLVSEVVFTVSADPAAESLESPLWYAAKWGGFDDRNADGLPQDDEWDENGDGVPDNYFYVANPSRVSDSLRTVFDRIDDVSRSSTSVGVTGSSLRSGSRVYATSFRSGDWSGELVSREVSATGQVATVPDWSANDSLKRQIRDDRRQILTWKPSSGTGIPFRWPGVPGDPAAGELDPAQALALSRDPVSGDVDLLGARRLAYVRGEEHDSLRARDKPLGDIVRSSPQLVGAPGYRYPDTWGESAAENARPYSRFARANLARQRVVYVGANDGMLHAFDAGRLVDGAWTAGTGEELFAYVPDAVYDNLAELGSQRYSHRYFVDATPRIADALFNGDWHTVLVGGLGSGGQAIYALDVTDPGAVDENSAADTVLWEFNDDDLGYTHDSPLIVRTHDGRWAAMFSSGYNSAERDGTAGDGRPYLYVLDLEDGSEIAKIAIGLAPDATPNALSAPTAVDLDGDAIVDIVYAGDLKGNIWKFDISSTDADQWAAVGAAPVFSATDANGAVQPITSAVSVGRHPSGEGVLVYVGTGKYLEASDQQADAARHRLYALWDKKPFEASALLRRALQDEALLAQAITGETELEVDADQDGNAESTVAIRRSTQQAIDWNDHLGWYLDLAVENAAGEQVITPVQLRENRIIASTHLPGGDPCAPGQEGWLVLLDAASGSMPGPSIDIDGDGLYSEAERLSGVAGIGNPFAEITVVSGETDDVILSNSLSGSGAQGTALDALTPLGRVSWRELEP